MLYAPKVTNDRSKFFFPSIKQFSLGMWCGAFERTRVTSLLARKKILFVSHQFRVERTLYEIGVGIGSRLKGTDDFNWAHGFIISHHFVILSNEYFRAFKWLGPIVFFPNSVICMDHLPL